jgi:hypothetical protein
MEWCFAAVKRQFRVIGPSLYTFVIEVAAPAIRPTNALTPAAERCSSDPGRGCLRIDAFVEPS